MRIFEIHQISADQWLVHPVNNNHVLSMGRTREDAVSNFLQEVGLFAQDEGINLLCKCGTETTNEILETLDDICRHAKGNDKGSFNVSADRIYLARDLIAKATNTKKSQGEKAANYFGMTFD